MKNTLIRIYNKEELSIDTVKIANQLAARYATVSWGLYDERHSDKIVERYGNTEFNTKRRKITGFASSQSLYKSYDFDPVVFAMNVDPLSKDFPSWSPYAAMGDNPIRNIDPDGRKFLNFNSNGDYIGKTHDNWFHNIFFKRGQILDNSGNVTRQFKFADRKNDVKDIENGTIKRVIVVTDQQLKIMVGRSGGFDHNNKTANRSIGDRYGYIKQAGKGNGPMDFSYTQIPKMFPGVSSTNPLDPKNPGTSIFLPPNPPATGDYAHNQMNFGNYLFGLSGEAQGFNLGELQYGAEYNSLFNPSTNGYKPQFDSRDDQFSIGKGYEYGQDMGYDQMEYKVVPGTATPSLSQPASR